MTRERDREFTGWVVATKHYIRNGIARLSANGDLDGRKAFLTRKLKVKGNIALAQKMQKFFPQG